MKNQFFLCAAFLVSLLTILSIDKVVELNPKSNAPYENSPIYGAWELTYGKYGIGNRK